MKVLYLICAVFFVSTVASGQSGLETMIATERAFAVSASEKGTKAAFLEYMSDDAVLFLPDKVAPRQYWMTHGESPGLLYRAPNYADISSNGIIGYTTGNWELKAKGKDDFPSAYGQFVTVWQRDAAGRYRYNVEIGISHGAPERFSSNIAAPASPPSPNERNTSAADTANNFFEIAGQTGLGKAYQTYAANDIRSYREGGFPMIGKGKLLSYIKKARTRTSLTKRTVFFGSADIAYVTNSYTQTKKDNSLEKGNFLQIWKFIDGRWQIVLDIFKPVPGR